MRKGKQLKLTKINCQVCDQYLTVTVYIQHGSDQGIQLKLHSAYFQSKVKKKSGNRNYEH